MAVEDQIVLSLVVSYRQQRPGDGLSAAKLPSDRVEIVLGEGSPCRGRTRSLVASRRAQIMILTIVLQGLLENDIVVGGQEPMDVEKLYEFLNLVAT
jgi:hypothetical protein